MKNAEAEQIAEKMQRALYFAVDDLDVNKMTGKWYTVECASLIIIFLKKIYLFNF